jgi:hypothetical protein
MQKINDTYSVVFEGKRMAERYYRDRAGWLKVSARGRVFRITAEQVLNHLLPALVVGDTLDLTVRVEHFEGPYWATLAQQEERAELAPGRSGYCHRG